MIQLTRNPNGSKPGQHDGSTINSLIALVTCCFPPVGACSTLKPLQEEDAIEQARR